IANNLSVATNSYTPSTPLNGGDSYQWNVQAFDTIGAMGASSGTSTFTVNVTPKVTSVIVDGTSWSPDFLNALKSSGLGSLGYTVPVGSSAQLQTLPWNGLNQIRIVFNENVNVQQNSLVLSGVNVGNYSFSSFSYDAATFTATWTLTAPIRADRLVVDLHSSGAGAITDSRGQSLDGEWNNAVSQYPSGNGVAGGDFLFDIDVLPGDANGDGVVNGLDINLAGSDFMQTGSGLAADFNGDATVNGLDVNTVASAWLSTLPASVNGVGHGVVLAAVTPSSLPDSGALGANVAMQQPLIDRAIIQSVAGPLDADSVELFAASVAASLARQSASAAEGVNAHRVAAAEGPISSQLSAFRESHRR
ncbi:MAG TPA: hypothetical protein VGG64_28610, partial [Pirellulales bacterium]